MLVIKQMWSINISVVTAQGSHLFPFRTEKLSPAAPMVLRKSGRVGRRRSLEKDISFAGILFCVVGDPRPLLPPLRVAPLRVAPLRGLPLRVAPLRVASLRGLPLRVAPLRGLPLRAGPLRGLPGLKSWVTINADFV